MILTITMSKDLLYLTKNPHKTKKEIIRKILTDWPIHLRFEIKDGLHQWRCVDEFAFAGEGTKEINADELILEYKG